MITFKSQAVEDQWDRVLPELQTILDEFGHWSSSERLPVPVIVCLGRTEEENAALYGGQHRFSWHVPKDGIIHAADLRTKHYTVAQKAKVIVWFNNRCPDVKKYELIVKPHGSGPHIHIAVRT